MRASVRPKAMRPSPRSLQRGFALVESMLAFVLLATGTLAVAALQVSVRLHTDVARQRSEAVRLGQEEIEALRAFSALPVTALGQTYDAIADIDAVVDRTAGHDSNTVYRIARRIDAAGISGAKSATVTVAWTDRSGAPRRVVLDSVIAGVDPAYSAALALGSGDGSPRGVLGRSRLVPIGAHVLGDGRSAWKPTNNGTTALVFDDASGGIVARCSGLAPDPSTSDISAADLAGCVRGTWASVSGVIRFSSARPPDAAQARDASLDVSTSLVLIGTGYPEPAECTSEPMQGVRYIATDTLHFASVALDASPASLGVAAWDDTGDRFVAYRCVVAPRPDGGWSGRVALLPSGWTVGTGAADHRVCRYLDDSSLAAADAGSRTGHPAEEIDGTGSLAGQNFLVVRGDQPCPAASVATASVAAFAGTVQHQP